MTTETKLMAMVEIVCKQIGYQRVILTLRFRHAIELHSQGHSWADAASLARCPTRRLPIIDDTLLEDAIRAYAAGEFAE